MWTESDSELLPEIIEETKAKHPQLESCSFGKGFWSPQGKVAVEQLLKLAVLPKKGRLSKADQERESAPEFGEARW